MARHLLFGALAVATLAVTTGAFTAEMLDVRGRYKLVGDYATDWCDACQNFSIGTKGDPGVKGEQGEHGAFGPVGEQGEVGEEGEKGMRGPRGPKGEEGPPGAQGDCIQVLVVEVQGAPGDKGPIGPPGDQGPPGECCQESNLPKGVAGLRGVPGPPGDNGITIGEMEAVSGLEIELQQLLQTLSGCCTANESTSVMARNSRRRRRHNKEEELHTLPTTARYKHSSQVKRAVPGFVTCKGPQGPPGDKGNVGDRGEPGPEGPTGAPGNTGQRGQRGVQGRRGERGPPGPVGPEPTCLPCAIPNTAETGDVGEPGDKGADGPEGDAQDCSTLQGLPGDLGMPGEAGDPGRDAAATDGPRYMEIRNETERLKAILACCSGHASTGRRRRQSGGNGGSETSLPEDRVCRCAFEADVGFPAVRESEFPICPYFVGDKGEQGPQGDAGAIGPTGPPGPPGRKGDQGEIGKPGKEGRRGRRGDPGPPGPHNERECGEPGAKGEKGEKGDPGPPGPRGATDCPTILGMTGDPGQKGSPGGTGRDAEGDISVMDYMNLKSLIEELDGKLASSLCCLPVESSPVPTQPSPTTTIATDDSTSSMMPSATDDGTSSLMPPATTDGTSSMMPSAITNGTSTMMPSATTDGTSTMMPPATTDGTSSMMPSATTDGTSTMMPPATTDGTSSMMPPVTDDGTSSMMPSATTDGTSSRMPPATTDGTSSMMPSATTNGTSTMMPSATTDGTSTMMPSATDDGTSTMMPSVTNDGTSSMMPSATSEVAPSMTMSVSSSSSPSVDPVPTSCPTTSSSPAPQSTECCDELKDRTDALNMTVMNTLTEVGSSLSPKEILGLQVISWTLETPEGIGNGPITVTVTSPKELTITLTQQQTTAFHSSNLLGGIAPVIGGRFLILMDITNILEATCADACTLFHENTAYVDPTTNTTKFLEFEWGITDGTSHTALQGPTGNTQFEFTAPDTAEVPQGTWKYSIGCLVPLTEKCPTDVKSNMQPSTTSEVAPSVTMPASSSSSPIPTSCPTSSSPAPQSTECCDELKDRTDALNMTVMNTLAEVESSSSEDTLGLQVISWTLETPEGIGNGPITVTVTSPKELTITLTQQQTIASHPSNLIRGLSPVVGAKFLILMDITRILEMPCIDACTLFHENTAYIDAATNATKLLNFEWGVTDGTFRTALQGPTRNTQFEFTAPDTAEVPQGTWKYRIGCLVPLTGKCPAQES